MTTRRMTITLSEPAWCALYAEGARTYESPSKVAARVVVEALPSYVAHCLARDLQEQPDDAATPPAAAEGAPRLTSPQDQAIAIVPGDGAEPEPGSDGTTA